MKNEEIIEILDGWNFWEKDIDIGILRENYLERLESLIATGQIVALTGVRRCGKSTLMRQYIKKHIQKGVNAASYLYVNFEEPKFSDDLSLKFLQQIYEAYCELIKHENEKNIFILLDEVQKIDGWEKFARGLHEKKEATIIVAGSTSRLLSKEFGTLLTGRWLELRLYPLSFVEFLYFNGVVFKTKLDILRNKIRIKKLLKGYLEFGGFPLVVLRDEKDDLLRRYFEDIVGRDIVQRYGVRSIDKLNSLAKYYLTNFSSFISYRRVAKFLGLSLDSVERFSFYMENTPLIYFVSKFSYSLKEQEVNLRKVYGIDFGLINIVSFRFSDNLGKLYENAVFLKLIQENNEIFYYKGKRECDFLVKKGNKITEVIQVSYELKENKGREIGGIIEAMNTFKLRESLVITDDKEGEEKIENKKIKYIPLWKWLLR